MAISLTSIGNCIGNIQLESTSHSLVKSDILDEATAQLLQSCPTLYDSMDCSPPGSFVHGILQARIREWVAIPSFRGSS